MGTSKEKDQSSAIGYLEQNPVISFHVPKEEKEKILEIAKKNDQTIKEIAREALRLYVNEEAVSYSRGYTEGFNKGKKIGYNNGYIESKEKYGISIPCSICGEGVMVTGKTAKERVPKAFEDILWGHKKCFDKEKNHF